MKTKNSIKNRSPAFRKERREKVRIKNINKRKMANEKTKSRQFIIPKSFLAEFTQELDSSGLDFDLIEVDEDGDLSMEVHYSPSEREEIMNLVELEDEYYSNNEQEENEEEDQDE